MSSEKLDISFALPRIFKGHFTGGLYCILKHAHLLSEKGHSVNLIPYPGSEHPEWIECNANFLLERSGLRTKLLRLGLERSLRKSNEFRAAVNSHSFQSRIRPSDITIATACETAPMVHRHGRGARAYFMQHFEPVFMEPGTPKFFAAAETYLLPLYKIANSLWLADRVTAFLRQSGVEERVFQSINAVDLGIFRKLPVAARRDSERRVVVISYGGRKVAWKGFEEMAHAMNAARRALPDHEIEWRVYGSACLPPDNSIAPYSGLGFLQTQELAKEYNRADILLSASWYESFPLFPIEAMACGLATIATGKGTEDFAQHGRNCEIVESKNIDSIAKGLIKVVRDEGYRKKLALNATQDAKALSWENASDRMEQVIREVVEIHREKGAGPHSFESFVEHL